MLGSELHDFGVAAKPRDVSPRLEHAGGPGSALGGTGVRHSEKEEQGQPRNPRQGLCIKARTEIECPRQRPPYLLLSY